MVSMLTNIHYEDNHTCPRQIRNDFIIPAQFEFDMKFTDCKYLLF